MVASRSSTIGGRCGRGCDSGIRERRARSRLRVRALAMVESLLRRARGRSSGRGPWAEPCKPGLARRAHHKHILTESSRFTRGVVATVPAPPEAGHTIRAVVHLRIVAPNAACRHVLDLLENSESAFNIVHFEGVARKPDGDLVLADVARKDVSLLVADLRELDVDVDGSIAIEEVDAEISKISEDAFRHRRDDFGSDPVVWENVSSRTSENVELSYSY